MSRSRRKTAIFGIAGSTEKQDKRLANRKFRRINKIILKITGDPEKLKAIKDVSDPWDWNKDGKGYVRDVSKHPELMRK